MINVLVIFYILHLNLHETSCLPKDVGLVGFFYPSDSMQKIAFNSAVYSINNSKFLLGESYLAGYVLDVPVKGSFALAKKTCDILSTGIFGIIGSRNALIPKFTENTVSTFHIPHLEIKMEFSENLASSSSLNLYPSPLSLTKAYADLLESMGWNRFIILYEDSEHFILNLLQLRISKNYSISVWHLTNLKEYASVLKEVASSDVSNIVLECKTERIRSFFKEAKKLRLMTKFHNYIIVSLDLHAVNLENFKHFKCSITGFQWLNLNQPGLKELTDSWAAEDYELMINSLSYMESELEDSIISNIRIGSVLTWDAVHLFATAVRSLDVRVPLYSERIFCNSTVPWTYGDLLVESIRNTNFTGYSGSFQFGPEGYRENFVFDVIALKKYGFEKVGTWKESYGVDFSTSTGVLFRADTSIDLSKKVGKDALKVVGVLRIPFLMSRRKLSQPPGRAIQYEGYIVDLLKELSIILGFEFIMHLAPKNSHGHKEKYNWHGSIGKLLAPPSEGRMEVAVGDFVLTPAREEIVSYSTPFMFGGIGALYVKPKRNKRKLNISPMSPFCDIVWLCIFAAYLCTSFLLFLISKISPYERERIPCFPNEPSENNFSLCNSLSFIFASAVLQGYECIPRALSARVIAGVWWFFALMTLALYTANLTAYYTLEKHEKRFIKTNDFLKLANQLGITYGMKRRGEVASYFKKTNNPKHKAMWTKMSRHTNYTLFLSDEEGIEKVLKEDGKFAYIMESTQLEYALHSNCKLMQLGELLHSFAYVFAYNRGSPYRNSFSRAILKLRKDGRLKMLKSKWWLEKRPFNCPVYQNFENETLATDWMFFSQHGIMGGSFVFLLLGTLIAFFIAIVEFLWKVCSKSRKGKTSLSKKIKKPLKITHTEEFLDENNAYGHGKQIIVYNGAVDPYSEEFQRGKKTQRNKNFKKSSSGTSFDNQLYESLDDHMKNEKWRHSDFMPTIKF